MLPYFYRSLDCLFNIFPSDIEVNIQVPHYKPFTRETGQHTDVQ